MPFDYQYQGSVSKGKAGTFIGSPAATHIHLVGDNSHIIYKAIGDREATRAEIRYLDNKDKKNKDKIAEINLLRGVYAELARMDAVPGAPQCKRWLRSYLVDYHEIGAAKLPLAGPVPEW